MYCPHCGTESTPGLNFCNRCGGNLSNLMTSAPQESHSSISTGKVWAIGTTTGLLILFGLGIIFAAINDQMHGGMPPDVIKMIIVLSMGVLVFGVLFLGWLWTRVLALPRKVDDAPRVNARSVPTNELGPARISALPEAHTPPVSSVTEHTTRTLEHAKKR